MTDIIGIDPGPVPGVCLLRTPSPAGRPDKWHGELAQCTPTTMWALIAAWLDAYDVRAIAIESYVVGPKAARVNDQAAQRATRDILGQLRIAVPVAIPRYERRAVDVKTWASNKRLAAAGLLIGGSSLVHARDAARHALFAACADFRATDPLSVKVGAR